MCMRICAYDKYGASRVLIMDGVRTQLGVNRVMWHCSLLEFVNRFESMWFDYYLRITTAVAPLLRCVACCTR